MKNKYLALVSAVSLMFGILGVLSTSQNIPNDSNLAQVVSTTTTPKTIQTTLTRFTVGSGVVTVSSGIPLYAGLLKDTDMKNVRVYVNGVEQAIYIEPLKGKHADGSLQSVLIQFPYNMSNTTPVNGYVVIGEVRTLADLPKFTSDRGLPEAVILPSDPNYLVSTNLVGPTLTAAQTAQVAGIKGAQYDADFATFVEKLWTTSADTWTENYYDRAQAYYAMWIRTGNTLYWYRGTKLLLSYRRDYLEANSYGTSPHWSQVDGLGLHYLLTGDEQSRYAITRIVPIFNYFRNTIGLGAKNSGDVENRIRARVLMAQLWAWRLADDKTALATELDKILSDVLGAQEADGSYKFTYICNQSLNYMDGMLNEALIQVYTNFKPDPRIITVVKKNTDWLWATQWVPLSSAVPSGGFQYTPTACGTIGGTEIVSELNGLILNGYAWLYAITGDAVAKAHADDIFNSSVERSFLYGSKQFNQQYSVSYRYFALRTGKLVVSPSVSTTPVTTPVVTPVVVTPTPQTTTVGGIVAHYKLDETTGSSAVDSVAGNTGTLTNSPIWSTGKSGGSLSFDGIDDYVNINETNSLNPVNISIGGWAYPTNASSGGIVLSKADGTEYYLRMFAGSARFVLKVNGNITTLESPYTFTNGNWYHLMGTYDGLNMKLYVNGTQIGTLAIPGAITTTTGPLNIGRRGASNINYWSGLIDDIRIYNIALNQSEISNIVSSANVTTPVPVVVNPDPVVTPTPDPVVTPTPVVTPDPVVVPTPTPVVTPPTTAPALKIGSTVYATAKLNVRSSPSTTARRLGTQPINAKGVITSGPTTAKGYVWWKVNFSTGADGWVINSLRQ